MSDRDQRTSTLVGTVLQGTYEVVRRVGEGGMGEVYEAKHARLPGRFAVKVLHREVASNPEAFARFRREAEITSALRHPNIVQVVDFNQLADGTPYIVMEFLDGVDLATRLERGGRMSPRRAVPLVAQVASACAAAHSQNVVHRDLKPQNIFLARVPGQDLEFAKVVDFGISKVKSATKNLTRESAVIGTPQYMSPEQATGRGDEVDSRTDQFALAAIAFEVLTGREAFIGENIAAIVYKVVHEDPPPLGDLITWVGPDVDAVIRKAMSKKRNDRFLTILDFARALEDAAGLGGARQRPTTDPASRDFEDGPTKVATSNPWAKAAGAAEPKTAEDAVTPAVVPGGPRSPSTLSYAGKRPGSTPEKVTTFSSTASELTRSRLGLGPRQKKVLTLAAAGVGALAALVVGAVSMGRKPPAAGRTAEATATIRASAAAPSRAPVQFPRLIAEKVPDMVTIQVKGGPAALVVTIDGAVVEPPVKLPRGRDARLVHLEAPGHQPRDVVVETQRDQTIDAALLRKPKRRADGEVVVGGTASPSAVKPTPTPKPAPAAKRGSFVDAL